MDRASSWQTALEFFGRGLAAALDTETLNLMMTIVLMMMMRRNANILIFPSILPYKNITTAILTYVCTSGMVPAIFINKYIQTWGTSKQYIRRLNLHVIAATETLQYQKNFIRHFCNIGLFLVLQVVLYRMKVRLNLFCSNNCPTTIMIFIFKTVHVHKY